MENMIIDPGARMLYELIVRALLVGIPLALAFVAAAIWK